MKLFIAILLGMTPFIITGSALAKDVTSLENAIAAWAMEEKTPPHKYASVDLNNDGIPDAVVLLTGSDYCGSGGCTLLVLKGLSGGYSVVSKSTITREPILLLQEKKRGWHTLSVAVSGGGAKAGQVLLRFNGSLYPGNPGMQPKATVSDLKGAKMLLSIK
jgi:hypothetical protein